jgi:hypothetical protein
MTQQLTLFSTQAPSAGLEGLGLLKWGGRDHGQWLLSLDRLGRIE